MKKATSINFIGIKNTAFIFSVILIIASIFLVASRGLNFGIDFTGGLLIEVSFDENNPPKISELRDLLKKDELGDISLQNIGSNHEVMIRAGVTESNDETQTSKEQLARINLIKNLLTTNYKDVEFLKTDYVGPKVGGELIEDGILSLILAIIAITIYVWIRFEWQFGIGAIVALAHDVIITLGFFSLTQIDFNLSSVAALLTIIGYSINDSVVVFDRIRENIRKSYKTTLPDIINNSLNDTLRRTLLTSGTTILALLALVIVGGEVILSFSLAALFGIVIGTYSSIYIASPIILYLGLDQNDEN